jgi:hypothetical protein
MSCEIIVNSLFIVVLLTITTTYGNPYKKTGILQHSE